MAGTEAARRMRKSAAETHTAGAYAPAALCMCSAQAVHAALPVSAFMVLAAQAGEREQSEGPQ